MHSPVLHGEGKNAFISTLREYTNSGSSSPKAQKPRGNSNSPRAKDHFMATMTTFPDKYKKIMKELHDYQKRLDERLSKPKKASASPKK